MFGALLSGAREVNAISFFPYFHFNTRLTKASSLAINDAPFHLRVSVLFGHESFMRDAEKVLVLQIAIRHAWLKLRSDEELCSQVVSSYCQDPGFVETIERFSGLVQ